MSNHGTLRMSNIIIITTWRMSNFFLHLVNNI